MTTLFDSQLSCRAFGSALLHVGDLLEWTKSKRLHLKSEPPIEGFEFAQVEALLCAIERNMQTLTPEQALEIVGNNPALREERTAKSPITARWLLGAEAHRAWREKLSTAIAANELNLLDFGSKLPIAGASVTKPASDGLLTREIAVCFADIHYTEANWPRRLSDIKWLGKHQAALGEVGGASALWHPLGIAYEICDREKDPKAKIALVKKLNRRFKENPVLGAWKDAFTEYADPILNEA